MEEKFKKMKEISGRMSDNELTLILIQNVMKMIEPESFTIGALIIKMAVLTNGLVERNIITEERGLKLAEVSAEIINNYFKKDRDE